jgi:hypothetical protein
MSSTPIPYVTTGELGDTLGVQAWRISRLFELGLVPETPRVAGRRMIPRGMIPQIVDCLRDRGWLPAKTEVPS